ncbi:MAG: protein kinase [Planctomycetes bacterium]|nr:protein kinase [Planctomycetota bacterium]
MAPETLLACSSCRKQFRVPNYNPASRYPCLNCGGTLVPTGLAGLPVQAVTEPVPPEVVAAAQDGSRRLGRFILVSELGRGGMGAVWKGWDNGLRRWVAVKVVMAQQGVSTEDLLRFRREAKTAAALDHPNIATIYDIGEAGGRHFIVMKLVEGRTLEDVFRVTPGNWPDTREVVAAVRDACRGVGFAHTLQIVHRDLKPANMMRDAGGHVFVMDFGLAKSLMAPGMTVTGARVFLGTPAFMSPEAANGMAKEVDPRSDVFSLGASLYTLLTGKHLFPERTAAEQLHRAATETAPKLRAARPDLPAELEEIVARACSRAKAGRPAHAGELADLLDRFLEKAPGAATDRAICVDDDAQIQPILEMLMSGLGLKAVTCGDGASAVAAARAGPAAVVILDAGLPDKSGFQVLKELRAVPGYDRTPIVMLTGMAGEDNVAAGFEAGADDYITKPFSNKEFKARIGRLLKKKGG